VSRAFSRERFTNAANANKSQQAHSLIFCLFRFFNEFGSAFGPGAQML
jgi:hypothetical protein